MVLRTLCAPVLPAPEVPLRDIAGHMEWRVIRLCEGKALRIRVASVVQRQVHICADDAFYCILDTSPCEHLRIYTGTIRPQLQHYLFMCTAWQMAAAHQCVNNAVRPW